MPKEKANLSPIDKFNKRGQKTQELKKNTKEISKKEGTLEMEPKSILFNFTTGENGPVKEFKNGERFIINKLISKKEEPKKVEATTYQVKGTRIAKKNNVKLLKCEIIKENKTIGEEEFSEKDLADYWNSNMLSFLDPDEKFSKEMMDWRKRTTNIKNENKKTKELPKTTKEKVPETEDRTKFLENKIAGLMEKIPVKDIKELETFDKFLEDLEKKPIDSKFAEIIKTGNKEKIKEFLRTTFEKEKVLNKN